MRKNSSFSTKFFILRALYSISKLVSMLINYIVKFFAQNENITHNNLLSCNYYAARKGFNIPCALFLKR